MLYLGKQECHNYINISKKNSTPDESLIKPGQFMLVYPNKEDAYFHYTSPSRMWDYNGNWITVPSYYPSYTTQFDCVLTNENNAGHGSFDFNNKIGGKYGTWTRGNEVVEYNEEDVVIMDIPTLTAKYFGMGGFYDEPGSPAYGVTVDIPENYEDGQYTKIYGAKYISYPDPISGEFITMQEELESIIQINGDILKIENGQINMYRNGTFVVTLEPYSDMGLEQDKFFTLKQTHDTTTNKRTYEVIEPTYKDDGTYTVFSW